jgi:hypothetical protein
MFITLKINAFLVLVFAAGSCLASEEMRGELGINLYGLSYHIERDRAKELGLDNEVNPGLGLRYRFARPDFDWFLDGGALRDSKRNTAVYAGGGAFWRPSERLRLGGALAFFHSETYNEGDPFIAPIPLAAYEWRALSLNLAYFPRIVGINDVNTLLFWLTVWPRGF